VLGFAVLLFATLSLFSLPLYMTTISLVAGAILCAVVSIRQPTMTRSSWIVLVAGMILIFGVLYLIGEDRVRHWRPHPAGYFPAWIVCFHAFRHIRHAFARIDKGVRGDA